MGGRPAEQAPGLVGAEPPRQHGRRQAGAQCEAGEREGMSGHMEERAPQDLGRDVVEALGEWPERARPRRAIGSQPRRGVLQRVHEHARAATVERMREVDLGPAPLEAVPVERQRCEEGRGDAEGVDG